MKLVATLFCSLMLSGCVQVISDQARTLVDPAASISSALSAPDSQLGKHILAGGRIVSATSSPALSSMEIEQYPVDAEGVLQNLDQSAGTFIAESTTFHDSTIYVPGSMVTMVGEVIGKRQVERNGVTMTLPVLTIKEIYLWDPEKFGGRKQYRLENPYAATHDKPLPERPLQPLNHLK